MSGIQSAFGKMRLHYEHLAQPHTTSVNLTSLVSWSNLGDMQSIADDLSGALCNVQPPSVQYTSWDSLDPYGDLGLSGGFTDPRIGLLPGSGHDWKSFTITFTGKEKTPGADGKYGNTDLRIFTGAAIEPSAGKLFYTASDSLALGIIATFLESEPRFWAGFHGHKASVRGNFPVQFNAHEQRKRGC